MRREMMCVLISPILLQLSTHLILTKYISDIISLRGQAYPSADNVNDIDDTRNGLLLSNLLHRPFATGKLAFLKVRYYFLFRATIPKLNPYSNFRLLTLR